MLLLSMLVHHIQQFFSIRKISFVFEYSNSIISHVDGLQINQMDLVQPLELVKLNHVLFLVDLSHPLMIQQKMVPKIILIQQ